MARIFINYRRDDTQGVAGRLFDYLASKYSRDELFMDVDAMQPGLDFAKQLDTQVSQCHVLLAVIGPHWIEAHDQAGHRRLDNDKDSVRVELASALQRDIAVIPVLVDGAVMPSEDSLPDNLKALSRRHAIELRHTRFNADADAICPCARKGSAAPPASVALCRAPARSLCSRNSRRPCCGRSSRTNLFRSRRSLCPPFRVCGVPPAANSAGRIGAAQFSRRHPSRLRQTRRTCVRARSRHRSGIAACAFEL